jgi:hypothetical protein
VRGMRLQTNRASPTVQLRGAVAAQKWSYFLARSYETSPQLQIDPTTQRKLSPRPCPMPAAGFVHLGRAAATYIQVHVISPVIGVLFMQHRGSSPTRVATAAGIIAALHHLRTAACKFATVCVSSVVRTCLCKSMAHRQGSLSSLYK